MNYLGRVVSSWKDFYNDLNAANLTGAIDILVIKQKDGSLKCSPFHVRFGKMGVLRPGDLQKKIEITVNGKLTPLYMKLDESGSAFFVEPVQPEENPTHAPTVDNVATTDLTKQLEQKSQDSEGKAAAVFSDESSESLVSVRSDENISIKGSPVKKATVAHSVTSSEPLETSTEEVQIPLPVVDDDNAILSSSLPAVLNGPSGVTINVDTIDWDNTSSRSHSISADYHPFSDGEVDNSKLAISRVDSPVPYSDTELELNWSRTAGESTINGPTTASENVTNRQTQATNDPQTRDWFFIRMMRYLRSSRSRRIPSLEEGIYLHELDSKKPETVSMYFPQQRERLNPDDLDTGQDSSGFGSTPLHSPTGTNSEQAKNICNQEVDDMMAVIDGAAVSLCGRLKEHDNEIPGELFLKYQVSFQDFCNNPTLFNNPNLVVRLAGKYYSWQVAAPMLMSILMFQQPLPMLVQEKLVNNVMPKKGSTRFSWFSGWGRSQGNGSLDKKDELGPAGGPALQRHYTQSISSDEEDLESNLPRRQRSLKRKKYHKSLYLTSDQLKTLELKEGMNDMRFSITTKFQGTCVAECTLYLWDYTDKIIVSDIDGTITRSDVAGQVLPWFGKDWTHTGVAGLFTMIHKNGYKLIYLSARAIGMSRMTKGFLHSVIQDNMSLPHGPLLLSPFSLLKAFHKEVIEKKPEEFKIACLQQIRSLFPEDCNPFYAGFGNKHTDAISYQTVDIPVHRIFTINHKGCLKHMLSLAFQSSYNSLSIMCDHMFPPYTKSDEEKCQEEFSDCNYWKQSFTSVEDLPEIA